MKVKLNKPCSLILFCLLFSSVTLHAQFFKTLANSVKNTVQNKTDNTADQATSNAMDKATSSSTSNNNSSATDTTATNNVIAAFAKAAKDNPNDTSASDLTMKAMENLRNRAGGVSAADSAEAIKIYKTAEDGSGIYYEYSIQANMKQTGPTESVSKIYFASNGEGRSEMNFAAMMGSKSASSLAIIGRTNEPRYSVTINDQIKAYSLNVIDTALINGGREKYQATKLGNETVQGYNCIHSKLVSTAGSSKFKSSTTMDIWTSVDVPGYALFKKVMLQQNITPAMMKALNDAGCGGFFVKMVTGDKNYSMTMELTKADKQSFPASLFKIPAGYKESKDNLMFGNMIQAAQKQ